jgi:hypothetical protein
MFAAERREQVEETENCLDGGPLSLLDVSQEAHCRSEASSSDVPSNDLRTLEHRSLAN